MIIKDENANKSMKLNFSALILSFIGSGILGVAVSYGNLYLFHIILIFISFMSLYKIKKKSFKFNFKILTSKYVRSFLIIIAWYAISLLWAPSLELGLKYIFYLFCGISLIISIVYLGKSLSHLNRIYRVASFFIFIEIIIALLESFTAFRMPISSYSKLATHFGKDPINYSAFDNIYNLTRISPPTGFHWNTNDLALCMAISLPFFLCCKNNLIKLCGPIIITLIVIMTASRAVFMGLILIFFLYLFAIKKKLGTLMVVCILSSTFFFSISFLKENENPRINELANSLEAATLYLTGEIDVSGSLKWRRELTENGLLAFSRTYGLGLGAGGSVANQEKIGPVAGRFTSMHNFWIEILVEGGVVAAAIIISLITSMIYNLFIISRKIVDSDMKYYSESLFLSLFGLIPSAIASSSTVYFFPMWIIFGFSISVISLSKKVNNMI